MGASDANGVGRNRNSESISGSIVYGECHVQYIRPRQTMACW